MVLKYGNESFRFNIDEKNELKRALKKYNNEKVRSFIEMLEDYCNWMIDKLKMPTTSQQINDLKDIKKSFKTSQRQIDKFIRCHWNIWNKLTFFDYFKYNPAKIVLPFEQIEVTKESLNGLMKIIEEEIELLKNQKRGRGRPPADDKRLVEGVAMLFNWFMDKPTSYENGPFANVVRIALQALGLPSKDPQRSIEKAIKKISG